MEEVEEAALLPAAPTLRSGKLDRPVQYRFFRRSNFLALREAGGPSQPIGPSAGAAHSSGYKVSPGLGIPSLWRLARF